MTREAPDEVLRRNAERGEHARRDFLLYGIGTALFAFGILFFEYAVDVLGGSNQGAHLTAGFAAAVFLLGQFKWLGTLRSALNEVEPMRDEVSSGRSSEMAGLERQLVETVLHVGATETYRSGSVPKPGAYDRMFTRTPGLIVVRSPQGLDGPEEIRLPCEYLIGRDEDGDIDEVQCVASDRTESFFQIEPIQRHYRSRVSAVAGMKAVMEAAAADVGGQIECGEGPACEVVRRFLRPEP
ncbi:hypothetical protein CKO28_17535 [Rhodovibrio sodomensis]|uniref:DUF3137 domain-containing protein n=1 Tax=Rhodovibrio sodomensis TaxID=1088 RepID=A0ABS1DH85_9PROT|nr:hypothetical protein [Rhodovibrio sodomensis]MBK1669841.1 hypothetical protein [Rhodovibrio sodomensis]